MHNTIAKIAKILLSLLVMTLSPFVFVLIGGTIYIIVQLINGLTLTDSISSFKTILVGLSPYFSYLTAIPVVAILLVLIIKSRDKILLKNKKVK